MAGLSVTGSAAAMRCDVTRSDQVEALLELAVDRFGSLDILVNNAGITREGSLKKMAEDQFDSVIEVLEVAGGRYL